MRNLKCLHQSEINTASPLPCSASAWDPLNDAILYALGPSADKPAIELRRASLEQHATSHGHSEEVLVASWDAPSPLPDLSVDEVLDLQYLTALESAVLVLRGGDLVVVRDNPAVEQESVEIVGSVDSGIACAAWSVDQDLLAIATCSGSFLLMTADFESISEAELKAEDAKLSKQVNVGWGKSETQFKGKGAKALRDPTIPEHVDSGHLTSFDNRETTISWRGDGAYVAINSVEQNERRMIRVFSRDGTLESVTEAVDGLEGALSWKPSGQLVGGLQRKDEELNVVFFERNGLRHGEFPLRMKGADESIRGFSLAWNKDSSVLAVAFQGRVQFWTMGNYYYYLKYDFVLDDETASAKVHWHSEDALSCFIHETPPPVQAPQDQTASMRTLRFALQPSDGSNISPHDQGYAAVIDGRILKLTPLRTANVPPPMALFELQTPQMGLDVHIHPRNESIGVLHTASMSVFNASPKDGEAQDWIFGRTFNLAQRKGLRPLQLSYSEAHGWLVLSIDSIAKKVLLTAVEASTCLLESSCARSALVCTVTASSSTLVVCDGAAKEIHDSEPGVSSAVCAFPGHVSKVAATKIDGQTVAFALTASGNLYANDKLLMRNCTSFLLTEVHLITTSASHLMKFTYIAGRDPSTLAIPDDQPTSDELCRSIERGARLITVVPSTCAVVLQMPRGNLETVYPRALVLTQIRNSIKAKHYRKAFMACRNHRVDMNILYDYDPSQFLSSVATIIDQLRKSEHVDLLLSQLSEEDVTHTLYKDPNSDGQEADSTKTGPKINSICNAFLAVLQTRQSTNLRNIITANLCKDPPDIESGLQIILNLQGQGSDQLDEAVEHICFLADVNRIYDTALGMYDLDLALLIAQQSQKDPREYLPYLQQLQELEATRRKFQIDDDLGRRSKAIEHLYTASGIDEVETYATKHELHAIALQVCKYNKPHHDQIMRSYADFLESRNRYKDAAIAYESLNEYKLASAAYSSANMWREALSSLQFSGAQTTEQELQALASALAEAQEAAKDYTAAAQIRLDYLREVHAAIRLFCKSHHFSEALRLAARDGGAGLVEQLVDPGLGEGLGALVELLSECKGQLNAQVPRLQELRTKRDADPLAFLEGGAAVGDGVDIPDDLSLAGSVTSTHASTLLTRYTARSGNSTLQTGVSRKTSRNAKREERKRARGKKGSVYEEEYLVNSVGRLIERVNSTGPDVERTVEGLCRRAMWERASTLDRAFREVVNMCETCVPDVWETPRVAAPELPQDADADEETVARSGGERVLFESLQAARQARTAPTVKPYVASALLPS